MGAFSGMKSAKRGHHSNRLTAGDYVVRVDRCDHFETDQMGECYKVTLTVLAVSDGSHKEGEVASATFSAKTAFNREQWLGNIKGFVAGVMGVSDDLVDEEAVVKTLTSHKSGEKGEDVLSGIVARVRSIEKLSKSGRDNNGNPRTYYTYHWDPALSPEEITSTLGPDRLAQFFPDGL